MSWSVSTRAHASATWSPTGCWSIAVLLARAIGDVQSAWPELRGHRIHQTLRRNPPTHTLFGVGPAGRHLSTRTPWPGLYCCGDWVYHPAPAFFIERACVTGIAAANAVLRAHGRPEWPLLAYPEPEPLARWVERLMVGGRRALRRTREAGGQKQEARSRRQDDRRRGE